MGGTIRKIKAGVVEEHVRAIFENPTHLASSGTSVIFKSAVSDMFVNHKEEEGIFVLKVQYIGDSGYVRSKGGATFPITRQQWNDQIQMQMDADEALLRAFGASFIPSILYHEIGLLTLFPAMLNYFIDVDVATTQFGFTVMESFRNVATIEQLSAYGSIRETADPENRFVQMAINEEALLAEVGYVQKDSNTSNFLVVDDEYVVMIDFGQVVKAAPSGVENPKGIFSHFKPVSKRQKKGSFKRRSALCLRRKKTT